MKARIGMISQWYDPERGSAALPGNIARSLLRRGHRVDVVTGFPNYPSGTVYPGYRIRPYQREVIEGVTVHRAPLYPSHDSHPLRRATNFLTFAGSASGVALSKLGSADAVLVHYTPATAAIPALTLNALRRKPYVIHLQDLWPQTVVSSGFLGESGAGRAERVLHRYCDAVYRHATMIAVTSPGMAEVVASRGVARDKIVFVPNWADEEAFRPVARNRELAGELGIDSEFTVMYAGNFGEFQALDVLIEAAKLLRERSDIGFVLVGSGVQEEHLRNMVAERNLTNVHFVGQQPFARMAEIMALGAVQVVSLQDLPLFRTTLPSKIQGTLAAGRPVIAAVSGDAAEVIERSGAGLVVTPGSAAELAQAIIGLSDSSPESLRSRGDASRRYYENHFSEQVIGDQLSDLLEFASSRGKTTR